MFVVGLGIGGVMQVLVVAVQNAVPVRPSWALPRHRPRSSGRSVERSASALFGAIFNSRLFAELPKFLLPSRCLRHLSGQNTCSSNPAGSNCSAPPIRHGYVQAFSHSLQTVFLDRSSLRRRRLRLDVVAQGGAPQG